jgi:hypothetical protein
METPNGGLTEAIVMVSLKERDDFTAWQGEAAWDNGGTRRGGEERSRRMG